MSKNHNEPTVHRSLKKAPSFLLLVFFIASQAQQRFTELNSLNRQSVEEKLTLAMCLAILRRFASPSSPRMACTASSFTLKMPMLRRFSGFSYGCTCADGEYSSKRLKRNSTQTNEDLLRTEIVVLDEELPQLEENRRTLSFA